MFIESDVVQRPDRVSGVLAGVENEAEVLACTSPEKESYRVPLCLDDGDAGKNPVWCNGKGGDSGNLEGQAQTSRCLETRINKWLECMMGYWAHGNGRYTCAFSPFANRRSVFNVATATKRGRSRGEEIRVLGVHVSAR